MKKRSRILSTAAVAAALTLVCSVGAYAYCTPYSYVSLDVNPSIEYTLNRFDRVLKVTAVNDDGAELVKELSLENLSNKKIDAAIAQTVRQIEADGYFDGETEGGIVISASAKDLKKAEAIVQKLGETAKETAEAEVEVETLSVGLERVQEARELGVTPGKLNLVEKLQAAAGSNAIDPEEWLQKPVREIMKEIKTNRKGAETPEEVEAVEEVKTEEELDAENEKAAQKEEKAQQKAEEKAAQTQEKEASKTEKAEEKTSEKAQKAEEKAASKALRASENEKPEKESKPEKENKSK